MSRIIKRAGRKGFYLQTPVPRDIRSIFKTSSIIRKLGNSEVDAQENKELLERQIRNEFYNARKENNLLSILSLNFNVW